MLLDGRLATAADQHRALEQIRDVLGRIAQLSREASEAAAWLERLERAAFERVDVRAILDHAISVTRRTHHLLYDCELGPATLVTTDRDALGTAIASLLEATAREHPGQPMHVRVRAHRATAQLELLAGPADRLSILGAGPDGPDATPLVVERGGLGLALVTAALVVGAHGAVTWTINEERGACGIRVPLET